LPSGSRRSTPRKFILRQAVGQLLADHSHLDPMSGRPLVREDEHVLRLLERELRG
jgi:hypothetical protein